MMSSPHSDVSFESMASPETDVDMVKDDATILAYEQARDRVPDASFTPPLLAAWLISLLAPFQLGYNIGVPGAANERVIFPGHSSLQWSLCVSIFSIGALIGALAAGPFGTAWPRRSGVLTVAVVYLVAGIIMMCATNVFMLILGRLIVGLAAGTTGVFIPLYIRELSTPNLRGTLGTGYQVAVTLGILTADILAFGCSGPYHNLFDLGWRLLFGFSAFISVFQILLLPLLPESPSWLVGVNRKEDAADILTELRGTADVGIELESIYDEVKLDEQDAQDQLGLGAVLHDMLHNRSTRLPLVVGCMLQVIQQVSGINGILFYSHFFFEKADQTNPQIGTAMVGTINFLSTGVALALMDRAGRRPLLIWSCAGMLVSQIAMTLGLLNGTPDGSTISVISMLCFVAFFEFGFGPIPWLIVAEMLSPTSRATAMSLATTVQWFFTFMIAFLFPSIQTGLDKCSWIPFSLCLVLSLIFICQRVPETKGMSVEEICDDMERRKETCGARRTRNDEQVADPL